MRNLPVAYILSVLTAVLVVACAPAPETKTTAPQSATPTKDAEIKPTTTGYAEVTASSSITRSTALVNPSC